MHFLDKNDNIYISIHPSSSLMLRNLNPEGFIWRRWGTWWNSPLNIFNLAKKWAILERLKKKIVSRSDWNHIKCMLPKFIMMHGFRPHFCQCWVVLKYSKNAYSFVTVWPTDLHNISNISFLYFGLNFRWHNVDFWILLCLKMQRKNIAASS